MVVPLGQQDSIIPGRNPTVMRYIYINRHARTPDKNETKPFIVVHTRLPKSFREIKFSGANADREIFIFPVQLTTCRIGNFNRPL